MSQMDAIRREAPPAVQRPQARSSLAFDWVMVALCAWLQGGGFLDGWAHNHGRVDASFLLDGPLRPLGTSGVCRGMV